MKKSDYLNHKNIKFIITFIVILCVFYVSIGYSAFSNSLKIENILATVRPNASARITNVSISGTSNGGISNSEEFDKDKILANISLPNNDSTVTYKVDITVFLSSEMKLSGISGLDPNLEYSISGYNLGDILCDSNNNCNLGATKDIYITIGYKNGVNNTGNTTHAINLDFNFEVVQVVAKIGNNRFQTLQDAIDAVPTDNTETTVHLLMNTSEVLTVSSGKNITFNMHGNTISNVGNKNVLVNNGTIRMSDGTISSSAAQGAINNNRSGVFIMSGGSIINTSSRQAIYNDGGTLTITGSAFLKNSSSERAAVQNLNGGTILITGGTIESTRYSAIRNDANLTIGIKDGTPASSPIIKGSKYGVLNNSDVKYYDGIIKGITSAFYDETKIIDTETSFTFIRRTEKIDGSTYNVVELNIPITITFNANGGSVNETTRIIGKGTSIGQLPEAEKTSFDFDGWFSESSGGTKIQSTTTFNSDTEIFAHYSQTMVAKIGDTEYPTIYLAVSAVPSSTPTTIDIIENIAVNQRILIGRNQNITFNLNNHTISNKGANMAIFENEGTAIIKNGTITNSAEQGAVNNRVSSSILTLDNVTIRATGKRQALYNEVGTTTITGNSILSSTSSERPTIHNKSNGTINIISATIESTASNGVECDTGTINIGTKDGNISSLNPSIKGTNYGLSCNGTINFYDGVIKGVTDAIDGTVQETDGTLTNSIEVISGVTYKTAFLQ